MRLYILGILLVLTGCAGSTLTQNLPYLVGRDIQTAIGVLGAPTGVTEYGEMQFVSWSVNHQGSMIVPTTTTTTTTGYVGTTPVYGSTVSSGTRVVPTNAVCTVTLHVHDQRITNWEWRGNENGCRQFANRVKHLSQ